jgi:hypothetical protein
MANRTGIWANHQELYPIPEGFEDTTYHNDTAPSYTGLNGRCMVWMHDETTQIDLWGDATHRPLFTVAYHPTMEVYGLSGDALLSMDFDTWANVLQLLAIIKASERTPLMALLPELGMH